MEGERASSPFLSILELASLNLESLAQHGGQVPTGSAERKAFMNGVMKQKVQSDEENFDEAVTLYRRAGTKHGVSERTFSRLLRHGRSR